LSYLLNVTDPRQESYAVHVVSSGPQKELDGDHSWASPTADDAQQPFWGFMGLPDMDTFWQTEAPDHFHPEVPDMTNLFSSPPQDKLGHGLNTCARDLLNLSQQLPKCTDHASWATRVSSFFSVDNYHGFLRAFVHRRYYQYPLIHWPSFVVEEASSYLMVAIMLTGASYLPYKEGLFENAASTAMAYEVAEMYIFQRMEQLNEYDADRPNEMQACLQLCQAALLLVGIGGGKHDGTIKRIVTKRLPTLVTFLRKLGLMGCRHAIAGTETNGRTWLATETRIRIVTWTFFMDTLTTLFCNKPPLMLLLELPGHLPCDEQVWDQPVSDEATMTVEETVWDVTCVRSLVQGILGADWDADQQNLYGRLTVQNLHVLICSKFYLGRQFLRPKLILTLR
jgi:hypothetical protein